MIVQENSNMTMDYSLGVFNFEVFENLNILHQVYRVDGTESSACDGACIACSREDRMTI